MQSQRFCTLAVGSFFLSAAIMALVLVAPPVAGPANAQQAESVDDGTVPQSTPDVPSAGAEQFSYDEREALQAIIREYILEHPEVILEAVRRLEARQRALEEQRQREALMAERDRLLDSENAPVMGNPEGDVALVEFFDYNCPYCKRMAGDMRKLIEGDDNLRIVMREFPILSEGSRFAARAALAARKQDKYEPFHFAMLEAKGRIDETRTLAIAEEVGLDVDRLLADMEEPDVQAHIKESNRLAEALGVRGTPAFIVGDEVIPGATSLSALQRAIGRAREGS